MASTSIRAYLTSVVVLRVLDDKTEVLLLKRTQTLAGQWCQVAGKIEDGETAWQAGIRELKEETGLAPRQFYSADICEQFYEHGRDIITLAPVFVAFVDGSDPVVLNAEHSDYRWTSFTEAMELVPFGGQRRVLKWIEDEFVHRQPTTYLRIDAR